MSSASKQQEEEFSQDAIPNSFLIVQLVKSC